MAGLAPPSSTAVSGGRLAGLSGMAKRVSKVLRRSGATEHTSSEQRDHWELRVREIYVEFRSVTDQLRPPNHRPSLPTTSGLIEIDHQLQQLLGPLDRLIDDAPEKPGEALQDLRRVSLALRSAVKAARTMRASCDSAGWPSTERVEVLVLHRSAELERVAESILWSIERP